MKTSFVFVHIICIWASVLHFLGEVQGESYGPRWWKVDLGYIAKLLMVNITNRLNEDAYPNVAERLRQFETCLSNSTVNTLNDRSHFHTQKDPLGSGETRSYPFESAGQVVLINKLDYNTDALTLCEVQVFAEVCSIVTTTSSAESIQSASTSFELTAQPPNCEEVAFAPTPESPSTGRRCLCRNRANVSIPITDEEVLARIETLKATLTVDKKTTSASKRKLISATDGRTSSKIIGAVGIVMLCVPVVFIVAMDLSRCVSWWSGLHN
ncbi:uncharacterized protein LOC110458117 isoform X2 [Mizuhopecten yessoensis]|uniref:uncharacterized protein LOC110458117 isoform X2 n=1 Tax=Mizuhopecten yessoensis TaxID=6573 RepID=UPI000B45E121|nr:uncharacterized protein LOC110458117 isoform X2 [Mizuhopecten yessoensis]